jgi:hypothetical protein
MVTFHVLEMKRISEKRSEVEYFSFSHERLSEASFVFGPGTSSFKWQRTPAFIIVMYVNP